MAMVVIAVVVLTRTSQDVVTLLRGISPLIFNQVYVTTLRISMPMDTETLAIPSKIFNSHCIFAALTFEGKGLLLPMLKYDSLQSTRSPSR